MEDRRREILFEATQGLAMPSSEQLQLLARGQMPVEELAETFNDIYLAVPHMRRSGIALSDEAVAALDHLDALLGAMSGARNADLWTESALSESPRWREVRDAASRALDLLTRS
jgi:hypothetical protein